MAYAFSLNLAPLTDGEAVWNLKEALVAGGWDVFDSGDATTGGINTDVHDPGGTYSGTLDILNSWVTLRGPVAMVPRRQIVFFKDIANVGQWTIAYSSNGIGYDTGATPSFPGSALDSETIAANSVDFFDGFQATYRQDIVIGDASENHSFFMSTRLTGNTEIGLGCNTALFLDVLDDANAADPDPAIVGCVFDQDGTNARFALPGANVFDAAYTGVSVTIGSSRGWYDKGVTDLWVTYPLLLWGNTSTPRTNGNREGANDAGEFAENSAWYWRGEGASQPGKKGRSHLFKTGSSGAGFMRPEGGLTPFARMNLGYVTIPWDSATRPIW